MIPRRMPLLPFLRLCLHRSTRPRYLPSRGAHMPSSLACTFCIPCARTALASSFSPDFGQKASFEVLPVPPLPVIQFGDLAPVPTLHLREEACYPRHPLNVLRAATGTPVLEAPESRFFHYCFVTSIWLLLPQSRQQVNSGLKVI